ncbi:unnamed protein product, partial [Closterium sp. NIES-65]
KQTSCNSLICNLSHCPPSLTLPTSHPNTFSPCPTIPLRVTILSLYLAATATTTHPAALLAAALRMRRGGLEWDRAAADAAEVVRRLRAGEPLLPRALRCVLQMTHPGELSRHAHAQLGISLPEPVLVTRASTCETAQLLYRSMSGRQVKDPLSLEYLLTTTGLAAEGEDEDEGDVRGLGRNKQAGGRHKEQQRRRDDWGSGQVSAEVLDEAEMLVSWVVINSVPSIV